MVKKDEEPRFKSGEQVRLLSGGPHRLIKEGNCVIQSVIHFRQRKEQLYHQNWHLTLVFKGLMS